MMRHMKIVRDDFMGNIQSINKNALREYFFTATRKKKPNKGGIDDEEFFGPEIFELLPQVAIERGEITSVKLHYIAG